MTDPIGPTLHDDIPLFSEALNFTASRMGFDLHLIEKDYYCTVLLAHLTEHGGDQLVFKGGTCLAKVHAGFYRLSEDLDFTIPLPVDASRRQRSQAFTQTKYAISKITDFIPALKCTDPPTGSNNSAQYNAEVIYKSQVTGQQEPIFIEVSIREQLLLPSIKGQAGTLLLDPIGGDAIVPTIGVNCIDLVEAVAEKFRAALSRPEVAIRDFFDIDYAVKHLGLDPTNDQLVDLVRRKIAVPGNMPVDVGAQRFADLKRQLDTRLRPVLRTTDFRTFNLDEPIQLVVNMARNVF